MKAQGQGQQLSEAKRRLLQLRMEGKGANASRDAIRVRSIGSSVPLSAEQRSVWLHASQQPEVPVYNEPFTIRRTGKFDLSTFKASLSEILRRHEAWRTSFSVNGEPVVHEAVSFELPFSDLSHFASEEREIEALRLATGDAQQTIPLDTVPLFRGRVIRMGVNDHRIYFTFHHLIFDGVSAARIFFPELAAIYAAFDLGKPSPLPDSQLGYGDYAVWRESRIDSAESQEHLAYWLDQFSGDLPVLDLPHDRQPPSLASHRGSMECFNLPEELVQKLNGLSARYGVTLYMTLLAAYKLLLFRYSGQDDLIVGSATDARRRPELEGVIGYFLDTYAIRTRPLAKASFARYLMEVRDAVLGGLAASDVPFDRIVREINPRRDPGKHPIFQAFFSTRPPSPTAIEGWSMTQTDVTVGSTKFDLYLELGERVDDLEARFFFNTEIWDASTIQRMAAHWLILLESICADPEGELGQFQMLTPGELAEQVGPGGWNHTDREFPQKTLAWLFERQVSNTPNAQAAAFQNEIWTYQELNDRAERHAARLIAAGAQRGSIVAVMLERSLDMLAGLIGILKTGAAYLPIDIHLPTPRLAAVLADANPVAILTQRSLVELSSSGLANMPVVVVVDEDGSAPVELLNAVQPLKASPPSRLTSQSVDDTAYLIYTSGTTGEPKGVEISQRSLVNLLTSMQAEPGFTASDTLLAVTPISFDIAALELFLPLISGGNVVIANREESRDPELLALAIARSESTVMQATPSTWRLLLLSGWGSSSQVAGTRSGKAFKVLCGGEALPYDLAAQLLGTGVELWNMYGPTETTIWSTTARVSPLAERTSQSISGLSSVGLPIANTTAFILDAQRQLLPVGIRGELWLGGAGLAKGYRNRPAATAERFVTVASAGGARLYRTGDIATRRPDGTIEILGRTDHQVKIRGHRIELEAVEAAVLAHPQVSAAAARVYPDPAGGFRLGVYVVLKVGASLEGQQIRSFLSQTGHESMVPSDVVFLKAIPLNANGKVDRNQLPVPEVDIQTAVAEEPPPAAESRLTEIWADLLKRPAVGPNENFFELGGHSILIAALQSRIARDFGSHLSVAELFYFPTVRQQASLIGADRVPKPPAGVLALQPHGKRSSIFWIHHFIGNLAKVIGSDQPFFSVTLSAEDFGKFEKSPTLQAIGTLLREKIQVIQPEGPYIVGGLCVGGILSYEIASQLRAAGQQVSLMVLLDAPNPAHQTAVHFPVFQPIYLRYLLSRLSRLRLRGTIWALLNRLTALFPKLFAMNRPKTEMRLAQDIIEAAAIAYRPPNYDAKVLLLQASERPPHEDFYPGWAGVVSGSLYATDVKGHHSDLLTSQDMQSVADAILVHLE